MRLRIIPLEERIVLDGAAAAQAAEAADDGQDAAAEAAAAEAEADANAQDGSQDSSGTDTQDATGQDGTGTDASDSDASDTDDAALEPVHVLAISSDVDQAQALADAALEDVVTVIYDASSMDSDDLLAQIEAALGGREADSIAFATHDLGTGAFYLTGDVNVSLATVAGDSEVQEFWTGIGDLLTDTGRIDLLSCGLAGTTEGEILVSQLESLSGHDVAASTDDTGNEVDGGDWVLETGDVDAAATYFSTSRLAQISGVLSGESKVTASDGDASDYFGSSVAISGSYAVVGAAYSDDLGVDSGVAYVFYNNGNSWVQVAKLTASDGQAGDLFGVSVAIDGDYIVVGASHDDDVATDNGSAYIFHLTNGSWVQESKLTSAATGGWAYFGCSVAIDGDYLVVGASNDSTTYDSGSGTWSGYQGAAYVYHYDGSSWTQFDKFAASDGEVLDAFGVSVDIDGTTIVVGAENDDDKGNNAGAAYVYELVSPVLSDEYWEFSQKLTAADGAAGDAFGHDVAVSGRSLMVSAYLDDDKGADSGSVYLYTLQTGAGSSSWAIAEKIVDSSGHAGDQFGYSIDMDGGYAVIASVYNDSRANDAGIAYIYKDSGSAFAPNWVYDSSFSPADGSANDYFGTAVAVSGGIVLGGSSCDDDRGADAGSAYFFDASSSSGGLPTGPDPVVDNAIPTQYAPVGYAYSFQFSLYTFDDDNGVGNLTYTVSPAFGGTLPSWLHFDAATRTFYGTPADADISSFPVKVTATDADGNSTYVIFTLYVDYNFAPVVNTPIADVTATEDAAFSYTIPDGSITDPNPGDTVTYTVTQEDGSALPAWLIWNPATMTLSGTPENGDVGIFSLKITATDSIGLSVSDVFKITVVNTNDAPTSSNGSVTVAEDGTKTFSASDFGFSDVDVGDALTTVKITGLNLPAGASLTYNGVAVTNGQVIAASSLGSLLFTPQADANGSAYASFTFQVGDSDGAYSADATMTINVSARNDAPVLTPSTPTLNTISEDAANNAGQTVASILGSSVADVDAGASKGIAITSLSSGNGTWQYSLNNGATWINVGSVSNNSALLLAADDLIRFVPDQENADSASFTYRAWDTTSGTAGTKANTSTNGGTSAYSTNTDTASITVTAVNDTPDGASLDNSTVDENAADGTLVGTLSGSDVDTGDTFTYTLVDDAGGRFSITGDQIFVADGSLLDYEASATHTIQVRVTDQSGASTIQSLVISLGDVNETPTDMAISNDTVVEHAVNGAVVGDLSTTDPDAGDTFTYTLIDNAGGRFAINGSQIVVANGTLLDYVTSGSHTVTVRCTDSGGLTVEKSFVITVQDNTPPTDILLSDNVDENSANGTVVGDLSAVDVNWGDTFSYTLLDNAGGAFSLSGNQILVADSSLLDHETAASRDIRVRVTDGAGNTFEKTISILIRDVNETPTDLSVPSGTVAEDTDTSSGVDLGALSATDPDSGDTQTYTITGGANASLFEVSGGHLWLKAGTVLDHETLASLEVQVTVTDSGGLTLSKTVTIVIGDVNEAPTDLSVPTTSIAEDADTSSPIDLGALTATDQDAGDSHTFGITGGADAALFQISGGHLQLKSGVSLDYETRSTLEVEITAIDSGGKTYVKTLTFSVTDVNESPSAVTIDNATVSEDTDTSSAVDVGTLATTDQDGGDTHTYAITGGANASLFQIVDGKLQLKAGASLDHETAGTLYVEVTSTDAGGLTLSRTFAITVGDVNEAPTTDNPASNQTTAEDAPFSYTLPANTFSDQDAGDTLTWTATLADGSALPSWLSFNAATRTFSGTPANGDVGVIQVLVKATDSSGLTTSTSFDLTVTNVNDAPQTGSAVGEQWATIDSAYSFQVPASAITDVDVGDSLTWTATLADGSALPAWLSFDAATRTFSGTPGSGDTAQITIRLTATDLSGASATSDFTLNLQHAPQTAGTIADQGASEDSGFSYQVPSTLFTDADSGDTLTMSATLENGTALPSWLSFNAATGTFSGTPTGSDAGTLRIALTATDSHGAKAVTYFTLNVASVNDAPVTVGNFSGQTVDAGSNFTFTVPANLFADEDGDALTYSATLADGSALPSWLTFDASTMTFSGLAMNSEQGIIGVRLTAMDGSGLSTFLTFDLTVEPNALGDDSVSEVAPVVLTPTTQTPTASTIVSPGSIVGGLSGLGAALGGDASTGMFSSAEGLFGGAVTEPYVPTTDGGDTGDGGGDDGDAGQDGGRDYSTGDERDGFFRDMSSEPGDDSGFRLDLAYEKTLDVFDDSYVTFLNKLERMSVESMSPEQLDKLTRGLEQMERVRSRIAGRLDADKAELSGQGIARHQARLAEVQERIQALKSKVAQARAQAGGGEAQPVMPAEAPGNDAQPESEQAAAPEAELKAAG